jgi:hypothetical protein
MGLWDLFGLLSGSPEYYARIRDDGGLVASAAIDRSGQEAVLTIQFAQAAGNENDIAGLTLISDGEAAHRANIYPGERQYALSFEDRWPDTATYELNLLDGDSDIIETTAVEIGRAE